MVKVHLGAVCPDKPVSHLGGRSSLFSYKLSEESPVQPVVFKIAWNCGCESGDETVLFVAVYGRQVGLGERAERTESQLELLEVRLTFN